METSSQNDTILSEALLIEQLKNGAPASFEYLVRTHGGYLLTIAKRYLVSDADAQDVVQEAYINAFKAISSFEGRSSLKSWLHKIVVNLALMKLRASKRHPVELIDDIASLFDSDGKRIETDSEISLSIEDLSVDSSKQTIVKSCIDAMPTTSRKLLLLRDIEGYSTEEVATLLNISVAAVKTGLHRARRALKEKLKDQPY